MSEKKGPFDAAIDAIRGWLRAIEAYSEMHVEEIANLEEAIHVLLDWSGWKPLTEAAGRVDRANALESLRDAIENGEGGTENYIRGLVESRALIESLPEKEKKG